MKTYTVDFRTDANCATRSFEAGTPEQALAIARVFYAEQEGALYFESYDGGQPVNEIAVRDAGGNQVALWQDDDLRLRFAAPELLTALEGQTEAAQAVIDNWAKGDLAAAVRGLDAWIAPAYEALAKAKGGQP
jgi:hypothetical protein